MHPPSRHINLGGYARAPFRECMGWGLDGGTAAAGAPANMYDPSLHLRTGPSFLFGNLLLWLGALALKFAIDYYILVRLAAGQRFRPV